MDRITIEKLQDDIEQQLACSVHPDDSQAVKAKLEILSTYLGTGAKCITGSKNLMLLKRREWLRKHIEKIEAFSPSIIKEFVNTACIEEEILYVRCDRNYSAIVHTIDALRSLLSILKAEMSL